MVRKTIGFLLTLCLMGYAGYQLAWHKDVRDKVIHDPWSSLGWLVLVVVALIVFVWSSVNHHRLSATIGAVLGAVCVLWGQHVLDGIEWSSLGWLLLLLFGVIVLWMVTVLDNVPGSGFVRRQFASVITPTGPTAPPNPTTPVAATATTP